jgi:glycosyltransferase involved in cell wall biosynthesis
MAMIDMKEAKVGVLIVAYNAEKTISNVISRIKEDAWNNIAEVFIFDDKSDDLTVNIAMKAKENHPYGEKIKIFYNEINLGYGGNQKRGYLYAIKKHFDIVLLLHGDGQYAPELINNMINPIVNGDADAVFGSRMLKQNAALKGGMPIYKYLGNKILTKVQNFLLKEHLSEYHSGYRAYSVKAISDVPFLENSNDFHFDTEIIIQFIEGKKKIIEIEIPTYYGDEICYVNGINYAKNVIQTTCLYRFFKAGYFYSKKFDLNSNDRYPIKLDKYSSHMRIIDIISNLGRIGSGCALDVGCGSSFIAHNIKKIGYTVTGIDINDSIKSREVCDYFIRHDLSTGLPFERNRKFDLIIFADILEHLNNPEHVLLQARNILNEDGRAIASTGNLAHIYNRISLLLGFFTYKEKGILDKTHARLFTINTFKKIFKDCGFNILNVKFCPIPFELIFFKKMHKISNFLSWINMLAIKISPALFSYQIIFLCEIDKESISNLLKKHQIFDDYNELGM